MKLSCAVIEISKSVDSPVQADISGSAINTLKLESSVESRQYLFFRGVVGASFGYAL